jgi:Domain of unknown function (DUF1995)
MLSAVYFMLLISPHLLPSNEAFRHAIFKYSHSSSLTQFLPLQMAAITYPYSIKNVVSKMTQSTQSALQNKITRMEVELPPTAEYGIELASIKKTLSTTDKIKKSNREVGRMYGDMLSSFSSNIVALFPTEDDANNARKIWGVTFRGTILSIELPDTSTQKYSKLRSRRFSALEQEQALLSTDGIYLPENTEVVLVIGPRAKDLDKIINIHEKLGDDALLILINGRLSAQTAPKTTSGTSSSSSDVDALKEIFTPVFYYAPPAINDKAINDANRDLLLYYEYGKQWSLAEKENKSKEVLGLNLGTSTVFNTLWEGAVMPDELQIKTALSSSNVKQ